MFTSRIKEEDLLRILLIENDRNIEQKKIRQKELIVSQSSAIRKNNYEMCKSLVDIIFEISDVIDFSILY